MSTKPNLIKCEKCTKLFNFSEKIVKVKHFENFKQVVIVCPHCNNETHAYFTNDKLTKSANRAYKASRHMHDSPQALANYNAKSIAHQTAFNEFQEKALTMFVKLAEQQKTPL